MVVDEAVNVVHGPNGAWKVTTAVARAMARLADGQLYGHVKIAQLAGYGPRASMRESVEGWRLHLDRIGVRLVEVPHVGLRVERIA